MNQFFYTRKEPIQGTDPLEFKEYLDSFNIEKVIRTIIVENENRLVLLDDVQKLISIGVIGVTDKLINGRKCKLVWV